MQHRQKFRCGAPLWTNAEKKKETLSFVPSSFAQDGPAKTLEKLQREAKKRWKAEEGRAACSALEGPGPVVFLVGLDLVFWMWSCSSWKIPSSLASATWQRPFWVIRASCENRSSSKKLLVASCC